MLMHFIQWEVRGKVPHLGVIIHGNAVQRHAADQFDHQ